MAFYDWNKNGKKDIQDDFIEYNIYKKSTENKSSYSGPSSNTNSGCLGAIIVIGIILFIGYLITQCGKPSVCSVPGCTNECTDDSKYCFTHDFWDRNYNNPTHYDEYLERSREEEKETESKTKEKSQYTPSKKSSSSSSYKSNKSKSDPYNVDDYSDPEDFYDDNYDDFWDYDEAEDYYNQYHE